MVKVDIPASLLRSLTGLRTDEAVKLVSAHGLFAQVYPARTIITMQARPNTILLWENDHQMVQYASPGDPLQVVGDDSEES